MFYKLKVTNKKRIEIVDIVEEKDANDNEYIYATRDELRLLNPKIINDYALGIDNIVTE